MGEDVGQEHLDINDRTAGKGSKAPLVGWRAELQWLY